MHKRRSYLLLALVTVAALVWGRLPPHIESANASSDAPPPPTTDVPPLVKLEPIIVNLNDEEETHYLKCAIELQLATSKDADLVTARVGLVRNEMILLLSGLTYPDTRGEKPKLELLDTIVVRLNRTLGGDKVKRAFFTDFVVQ